MKKSHPIPPETSMDTSKLHVSAPGGIPDHEESPSKSHSRQLPKLSVHRLFEAQVAKNPQAPCLRYQGETWTYADVNQKANRIASLLIDKGLKPGQFVGVLVTRTPHMVTSLLAILKTGCAYVPLDPEAPQKRIKFILEDLQTPWVICPQSLEKFSEALGIQAINYEHALEDDTLHSQNQAFEGFAKTPAYVMYTSGTTGNPKGALIEHGGIVRLVCEVNYFPCDASAVFMQTSTAAFDAATYEIWAAFLNGCALVCIAKDILLDPNQFAETIDKENITHLHLTTGLFNVLVQSRPQVFAKVESLLTGGEAMNVELARKLYESFPPKNFCNVYGPTENTTYSTFEPLNDQNLAGPRAPIGKAISHSTTMVVAEDGTLLNSGEEGELWVGGPGLAQCYWRRPALTAEKFVPNGFTDQPGARAYRTGDKVTVLPSGSIDFLGRIDFQIKLRGFRIELGEIEAAIKSLDGVRDALVLLREDQPGDKRLAAYWLAEKDAPTIPGHEQLTTALANLVPEYMIPSDWVHLDAFPLNANDKYDRKALPAPGRLDQGQATSEQEQVGRNPIEIKLLQLWDAVLETASSGIEDDFFASGGDQVRGKQLLAEIQTVFHANLSLDDLSEASTVTALAQAIFDNLRHQVRNPTEAASPPAQLDETPEKSSTTPQAEEIPTVSAKPKTIILGQSAPPLKPRPLGRAALGRQVLILDADLTLLPPGALGELWLGGHGLARGYKNQPGLTAEKFVPHPYSKQPGARLYRTGDLARVLANGEVVLMDSNRQNTALSKASGKSC